MLDLAKILRTQLLPWAQHNPRERFIIARPEMEAAQMPPEVKLAYNKITGRRVIVKNRRDYDNTRNVTAVWPAEGLNEVNKFKLVCTLTGHIDYQIGHYRLQCGPGHFIFIPPGLPHPDGSRPYVDAQKSDFCEVLFFVGHSNAIACWLTHYDERGKTLKGNYIVLHEHVRHLFGVMMKEITAGDETSLDIGTALLPVFVLAFQREVLDERLLSVQGAAPRLTLTDSIRDEFVARLEDHMRANLHQTLTLESVAKEMYLSRAQFTRRVRTATGQSFHELLTAYRLEEAKRLLQNSQWTAATVAAQVGLKSDSYFRTFFRTHTGQTPTEFRTNASNTVPVKE